MSGVVRDFCFEENTSIKTSIGHKTNTIFENAGNYLNNEVNPNTSVNELCLSSKSESNKVRVLES